VGQGDDAQGVRPDGRLLRRGVARWGRSTYNRRHERQEGRAQKDEFEEQEGVIARHGAELGGGRRGRRFRATRAAAGDRAGPGGDGRQTPVPEDGRTGDPGARRRTGPAPAGEARLPLTEVDRAVLSTERGAQLRDREGGQGALQVRGDPGQLPRVGGPPPGRGTDGPRVGSSAPSCQEDSARHRG
jgi:hypothetical protein